MNPAPPKPGKGLIALQVHLDSGVGVDLTEAGTQKRLAVWLVPDPAVVPGIATGTGRAAGQSGAPGRSVGVPTTVASRR